ncbi:RNA 2',3'-cyclic phosphodiesterase [Aerolutibacter ruishenii]|uniref:RNA 2',3'-cyclic phosphodiesterase n=1 Tax=Aerolutibacter ruishenii TaxID=686800 RepID=A0A562LWT5_9GAMM|nr:RNA 2',3'-cyclic phosphodiesterase [Lysobacter ruishenii]TWI12066.1 2'-5' RNA ligase [Lysobacter ruishenii]
MPSGDRSGTGDAVAQNGRHRLFFALVPDETTRERLSRAAKRLRIEQGAHGRWIDPRRYHLTMQFLGDFDGLPHSLLAQARAAAASVRVAPFTLVVDRAGSFANRSIPWWLGPGAEVPGLAGLWGELGVALAHAGVPVAGGHHFRPHVTVLRDAGAPLPAALSVPPIEWRVEAFNLLDSAVAQQGAYTWQGSWPLVA